MSAIGRLRADAFDHLEPGRPEQNERSEYSRRLLIGDRGDLELRELYLEHQFGDLYTKTGKQQIVWGKADGLKVLDIVNPQEFREFILDEFEDSRIPLWSFNAEYMLNEVTTQIVWLPDNTYHEIPERDATFAFTSPQLLPTAPPGVATVIRKPQRPKRFWADSDAGIRLSTFWHGWDLALSYFYHYADVPVLYQSLSFPLGIPTVTVTPEYKRSQMTGLSFSKAFGDVTLRGETAYFSDRYSLADLSLDDDGVVRTTEFAYVLGLDWQGLTDTFISIQFFQSILDGSPPGLIRDKTESTATLLMRRNLLNETLTPEIIWIHGLNLDDGLFRPKISFELSDISKIWIGVDIFYGDADGLFGQFDDNDRVVAGILMRF